MRSALLLTLLLAVPSLAAVPAADAPAPGRHGHYAVLTAEWDVAPPFAAVDIVHGPREGQAIWRQIEARPQDKPDAVPLFALRTLAAPDGTVERYVLRLPGEERPLDYRDVHTGKALLPPWRDFAHHFLPRSGPGTHRQRGMPETLEYLGHTLTLRWAGENVPWAEWPEAKVLLLDRELLVGTGRSFKDAEGKRLPQTPKAQNYTYIPFTADDYRVMIEAGINLFLVEPNQQEHVAAENVFFLRGPGAGKGGEAPLAWPADFYRSNYVGNTMFMDEPAILMVGDKQVHNTLRHWSDATALLTQRVRSRYHSGGGYSAFSLERTLKGMGVNLGSMRLEQHDYPAWETIYPSAHYQLKAGLAGIVHEGRYQLDEFDRAIARWTAKPRKHTPEEMLRYHYAFLRGAARSFGGAPAGRSWGTSIYGQADPAISPQALTLAYDLGARYLWFWTSDHGHHMPWPEQLALARHLKEHRLRNPRPSIVREPLPTLDLAIVIPQGYWLELGDLWWVRAIDKEGKNEHAQRFARVMRRAHAEIHKAMDAKLDFDVVVDEGAAVRGYERAVRIGDEP